MWRWISLDPSDIATLRELLLVPSAKTWDEFLAFVMEYEDCDRDLVVLYAQEHLQDWPEVLRVFPTNGFDVKELTRLGPFASFISTLRIGPQELKSLHSLGRDVLLPLLGVADHLSFFLDVYAYSKEMGGWYSDLELIRFGEIDESLKLLTELAGLVEWKTMTLSFKVQPHAGQQAEDHSDIGPYLTKAVQPMLGLAGEVYFHQLDELPLWRR